MKNKNRAFSLIEVIVATSILTISFFGVYKLIGENTKTIGNSSNYMDSFNLFPVVEECLEDIGFDSFDRTIGNKENINFGVNTNLDACNIGKLEVNINNVVYIPTIEVLNSGADFIEWEISIESEVSKTLTGYYKQFRK